MMPQVADDVFVMDFNPCVLSALQAFGLALSSFRSRTCITQVDALPLPEGHLMRLVLVMAALMAITFTGLFAWLLS